MEVASSVGLAAIAPIAPSVVGAFVAGLISFVSPCVLPLVPGYLSLVSGLSSTSVEHPNEVERRQLVLTSLLFVLGFSVVFTAYGAIASSLGELMLKHKALLTEIAGALVIIMGLMVAGVLRLGLLSRERRFHVSPAQLGPYAAPVMGMAFAFGWTPCVGPVLAAVLTLAAARDTLSQGVGLLLVYSLGLGVPFVIVGVAFGRFRSTWHWFKRHGRAVDRVAGVLLMSIGVLLVTSQFGHVSSVVTWLWTAVGASRLTVG